MKIGIDCHNLESNRMGMGRYLLNLLNYWADLEPEFILYFKNHVPGDIPSGKNFKNEILETKSNAAFEHFLLPKATKKDKIDLFFSPSYILPLRISKKIKTAVAVHDISYEAHPEWFSWQNRILLRRVSKKSAKRADIIFTPSEFTKKEILKYWQPNSNKVFVVPLAADQKFRYYSSAFLVRPSEADSGLNSKPLRLNSETVPASEFKTRIGTIPELAEILKKYKIKNKFIFYIGAIFNRRFIPECIEAFKQIAEKFPEYQFLISGTNYTHPFVDINYIIKKANADVGREAILKIDYAEEGDLVYLYNAADLFIYLSSYEGFGLPPIEALACGTPVITTKMGSLAEAVGDSAVFVKNPEDVKEISGAMEKILSDEHFRKELIKKGLKQAQKFSWEKTAKETLKILTNYEK